MAYKQKYGSVAKMMGGKTGLAHKSSSMAKQMSIDVDPKGGETGRYYNIAHREGKDGDFVKGTLRVSEKSIKDAREGKGYFKPMPDFKGKLFYTENGKYVRGYKKHDGSYEEYQIPTMAANKKVIKQFENDRKKYNMKKRQKDIRIEDFSRAIDVKTGQPGI
jgi:hypothetical protein